MFSLWPVLLSISTIIITKGGGGGNLARHGAGTVVDVGFQVGGGSWLGSGGHPGLFPEVVHSHHRPECMQTDNRTLFLPLIK